MSRFPLQQLARLCGVQTSYTDMAGRIQHASPRVLFGVLRSLGLPLGSSKDIPATVHELKQKRARAVIDPVIVAWNGKLPRFPARSPKRAKLELTLEDGTVKARGLDGQLPNGYHALTVHSGDATRYATIIAAPRRAYSDPALHRAWGVFAPMYAVHSERSWGAGNVGDWWTLSDWITSLGGTVAATLPLLSTFIDYPACDPGPYSPASRLFWNEFYLDIEAIPEFQTCSAARKLAASAAFRRKLAAFRADPLIDWREQWRIRRVVLEKVCEHFFTAPRGERWQAFQKFITPRIRDYARFRAACERTGQFWQRWPARMREGKLRAGDFSERAFRLHLYVQWLAQEQMGQLLEHGCHRGLQMYLDLPLGAHAGSYDAWRHQHAFALGTRVGSPPDPVFSRGQDWGFCPLHPERIRDSGYRYLRDYLGFQMRHTGMLRIDHVMGLHRLYWIPEGHSAAEGAYVHYIADELYAILCLESQRHKTVLVGEDLGTVPPEVPKRMAGHRLRRMYVVQYSLTPKPKAVPPPQNSVASLNTHDMPPFAAFCEGLDIFDRAELGLIPRGKIPSELRTRKQLLESLRTFLRRRRLLPKNDHTLPALLRATLQWLASSDAEVVLVNLEDLWLETQPQNVPSTVCERANWRRKTAYSIEQIMTAPVFRELLAEIAALREAGRANRPR
jgi:4-alpha-glucanotransferase